jgi:DNA/RNA-binding domain of Phe-tRNA-synthetase-like protein
MAKNSDAQYEVVAVDDEDGVQWRQWRWLQQRLTALKTKARRWQCEDGI